MSTSSNYLNSLIALANSAATNKKNIIDQDLKLGASGTFSKDSLGNDVYTPGTEGTLDVGYQRAKETTSAGLESRGILKSGQAAITKGRQASDYQTSVMNLYNQAQRLKGGVDEQTALKIGEYRAAYGDGTDGTVGEMNPPPPTLAPVTQAPVMPPYANTPQGQTYDSAVGRVLYGDNGMTPATQAPQPAPTPPKTYDQQLGSVLYGDMFDQIPGASTAFTTQPKIAPSRKLATQKAKKK